MIRRPPRSPLFPTRRSSDLTTSNRPSNRTAQSLGLYQQTSSSRSRPPERSEEHTSNSSHPSISYAVFCLKKKNHPATTSQPKTTRQPHQLKHNVARTPHTND